jgi:hypothetical protein
MLSLEVMRITRANVSKRITHSTSAIALLALAVVALADRPARACSYAPPAPKMRTLPADGARGVPTNTHLVVDLLAARLYEVPAHEDWLELRDATGNLVPTTRADGFAWDAERVPTAPLAPQTTYTLQLRSGTTTISSSFTTGSGPSTATPAMPLGRMEHYLLPSQETSCDPLPSGTCVAVPEDAVVELTFVDTFGQEQGSGWSTEGERIPYLQRGPFFVNLSGIDQGTNFLCARLRTRALDGTVSEPVELCGADAPTFALTSRAVTCTPQGLRVDGALPVTSGRLIPTAHAGDGCAVAGGPARSAPWLALGLAAALLFVGRRRAR